MGGPSRTTNVAGILNTDWFITNGGDGFETAIDWSNPDIVYAQAQYGWLVRYDKSTGEKVPIQPMPGKGEDPYRWNWDSPLLVSPHDASTIYFASNGHVGMGGFDIYKTSQDDNGAYVLPVNLKSPVNSSGDDFGMILEKGGERGYLTSNRKSYIDQEGTQKKLNGSDNIFQFELPPLILTLQGVILNEKSFEWYTTNR